jgi:Uncharacterized conserved protein
LKEEKEKKMSKFIAEKSFWDIFPQAEIGIVVINGMDNSEAKYAEHPEIESNLKEANKEVNKFFTSDQLSQCSVVSVWRDAFQKFKKKKGNRASIEALLSRVIKGNAVGTINPLVDIYNSVSLTYGLPVGGENLDSFAGNLRLTISEEGGDEFLALGDEENNPTLPGELCYLDDIGAVCRCWNWRDGQRTMLTEETKNAFLIIESVDPSRHDDLLAAMDALAENAVKYLGGSVFAKTLINIGNPEMEMN